MGHLKPSDKEEIKDQHLPNNDYLEKKIINLKKFS